VAKIDLKPTQENTCAHRGTGILAGEEIDYFRKQLEKKPNSLLMAQEEKGETAATGKR